jgi:hypothetical protein
VEHGVVEPPDQHSLRGDGAGFGDEFGRVHPHGRLGVVEVQDQRAASRLIAERGLRVLEVGPRQRVVERLRSLS